MAKTIGIITADPETDPSIQVFSSLQTEMGFRLKVIDPLLPFDEENFAGVDILYHRISGQGKELVNKKVDFYLQAIEQTGLPYIGNKENIRLLKNKFFQITQAKQAGLAVPKTVQLNPAKIDYDLLSAQFDLPVVLKSAYSFGGNDVFLISDWTKLNEWLTNEEYILQEFIKLDKVVDFRVYVVGDETVGGIIRENTKTGEFRANTSQGGTATFFNPDEELSELAIKYTKQVFAEILAVDFIKKDDEYMFIEANDAFSVKVDNEPQKIKIAKKIVSYCLAKVN